MSGAAVVEIHSTESAFDGLTPKQRAFVWFYVAGEDGVRGVAYRAYMAAGYTASTRESAYAASSVLLKHPNVRAAMDEVRSGVEEEAKVRMQSWVVLAVRAQHIIQKHMDGEEILTESRQKTCFHILDRAFGRPAQPIEQEIGERFDALIRELSGEDAGGGGDKTEHLVGKGVEVDELVEIIGATKTPMSTWVPPHRGETPVDLGVGDGAPRSTNDRSSNPNSSDEPNPISPDEGLFPELKLCKPPKPDPKEK